MTTGKRGGLMPAFTYPEQGDHEPDNEYWDRVRHAGIPFPWDTDKATPPGPIVVSHEWSLRDPGNADRILCDLYLTTRSDLVEQLQGERPDCVLVQRTRWTSVGDWQDAEPSP